MAKKDKDNKDKKDDKKEGNKILTILIVLLIVIIWLAVFTILIKLDIGGFGSGVLRPILKDVPVVSMILPNESDSQLAQENNYDYKSLPEAIAKIKELEQTIDDMSTTGTTDAETIAELKKEVERLKVFEDNQTAFEEKVKDFDKNVVFNDNAPSIEEYQKYYESIDPTNAAALYQQVIEQLQYSDAIKAKADIYKNMDPAAAAAVFETMTADIENVANILLSMKPKESAAIISAMDPVVAAKITKKMLDMDAEKLADTAATAG
jgi:flagellar motility protein MotE (MotC chaperone)